MKVGGGEGGVPIPLVSSGEKLACGMPPDKEKGKRKKREKRSGFERQKGWWVAFILQATPFKKSPRCIDDSCARCCTTLSCCFGQDNVVYTCCHGVACLKDAKKQRVDHFLKSLTLWLKSLLKSDILNQLYI